MVSKNHQKIKLKIPKAEKEELGKKTELRSRKKLNGKLKQTGQSQTPYQKNIILLTTISFSTLKNSFLFIINCQQNWYVVIYFVYISNVRIIWQKNVDGNILEEFDF